MNSKTPVHCNCASGSCKKRKNYGSMANSNSFEFDSVYRVLLFHVRAAFERGCTIGLKEAGWTNRRHVCHLGGHWSSDATLR